MTVDPGRVAPLLGTWDELTQVVTGCTACPELAAARTRVVPGVAPSGARVLLIGEAPGAQEDAAGLPFVGRSGALLDTLLAEVGLPRSTVAVANVLKCRPPRNRTPRKAEVERCRPWLVRQIQLIDPTVVMTLGSTALAWALGSGARIGALPRAGTSVEGAAARRDLSPVGRDPVRPQRRSDGGPPRRPQDGRRAPGRRRPVTEALRVQVPTVDEMRTCGERLATVLRAGDLLVLTGDLGAGKTTLTQGIGSGLGVRGAVTSPSFVIARVHPSLSGGPPLVHVDAYRLGGWDELEDLDLEATLDEAVTVVEWGEGLAEGLADDRLEIAVVRAHGAEIDAATEDHDPRQLLITPVGARWRDVELSAVLGKD